MPSDKRWVGTWAAAPAPAEGIVGFNNQTMRMNPRVSIGGDRLRVRISNAYGNRPLIDRRRARSRCATRVRRSSPAPTAS